MKSWRNLHGACTALALLVLLPFGVSAAENDDLLHRVDAEVGFSNVEREYEDMDEIYAREGVERDLVQVRRVAEGQSRSELEALLGAFEIEHDDGSLEYYLSLPLSQSTQLTCQYRVFFDSQDKVESAVWRRPQCAHLAVGQTQ